MREVRYDTAFTFKYSERPLTKASKLDDDIPDPVKVSRLERLISLQQTIAREKNEAQVGRDTEILIEGPAPKDPNMWSGRTPDFRPVVIPQNGEQIGDLIKVRLDSLTGFTFHASRISDN
jgi:tRNA-2-methylthio-N6-dimethylallyladenosine synthase